MKKIITIISFVLVATSIQAQISDTIKTADSTKIAEQAKLETQTKPSNNSSSKTDEEYEINSLSNSVSNLTYGGYGSFTMKNSSFGKTNGWLIGVNGAFVFQHKFIIGGGFHTLSSSLKFNGIDAEGISEQPLTAGFSYGSIFLEYSPKTDKTFHLSYPVWFGWGSAKVFSFENGIKGDLVEKSKFFMIEPSAVLEANISSTLRIYGGASMRVAFLNDELINVTNNDLNAFVLSFGVKVGRF